MVNGVIEITKELRKEIDRVENALITRLLDQKAIVKSLIQIENGLGWIYIKLGVSTNLAQPFDCPLILNDVMVDQWIQCSYKDLNTRIFKPFKEKLQSNMRSLMPSYSDFILSPHGIRQSFRESYFNLKGLSDTLDKAVMQTSCEGIPKAIDGLIDSICLGVNADLLTISILFIGTGFFVLCSSLNLMIIRYHCMKRHPEILSSSSARDELPFPVTECIQSPVDNITTLSPRRPKINREIKSGY